MSDDYSLALRRKRDHLPIPSAQDFYIAPIGDAASAWKVFGGLTLEQAYERFLECPEYCQEHFMWMFPKAFEYYYPTIDQYLREVSNHETNRAYDGYDGCHAEILGCDIESQFHWKDGTKPPPYVVDEIAELSAFVKANLSRYSDCPVEQERIRESFLKVDAAVTEFRAALPN